MRVGRRSFLKILGGTAAAAVAAPILPASTGPLFVPAERLDFGVPHQIVTAQSLAEVQPLASGIGFYGDVPTAAARMANAIPMTLLQNEYLREWGGRLAAGSTVLVDQVTADRWVRNGVAVAGPGAPVAMQTASAKEQAERQKVRDARQQESAAWLPAEPWGEPNPVKRWGLSPANAADLLTTRLVQAARRSTYGSGLQFDDDEFTVPEGFA